MGEDEKDVALRALLEQQKRYEEYIPKAANSEEKAEYERLLDNVKARLRELGDKGVTGAKAAARRRGRPRKTTTTARKTPTRKASSK